MLYSWWKIEKILWWKIEKILLGWIDTFSLGLMLSWINADERDTHTHTLSLSLSFGIFVSCLLYLVPFFLAAFFFGAPTRRIHKPSFVWHIDRWGAEGAGHEGRTKAREKGQRLGKKVGRHIGMQKPWLGSCVSFLFGTSWFGTRTYRTTTCFIGLFAKWRKGKLCVCVCVCVCFFTLLQRKWKESFGCVCLFFLSSLAKWSKGKLWVCVFFLALLQSEAKESFGYVCVYFELPFEVK
jgi:hypothetical protein